MVISDESVHVCSLYNSRILDHSEHTIFTIPYPCFLHYLLLGGSIYQRGGKVSFIVEGYIYICSVNVLL